MECVLLEEFLQYLTVIRSRSPRTVESYKRDLVMFLRYLLCRRAGIDRPSDEELADAELSRVDLPLLRSVERRDVMEFLAWTAGERDNGGRTRKRKLSALRTFFRYQVTVMRALPSNPAAEIDTPTLPRTLPRFLSEEESIELLKAVLRDESTRTRERDYAILTLFLNCGMRLSELVGINLTDLDPDLRSLRVTGKGAKERIVYLNNACREALTLYFPHRDPEDRVKPRDRGALFLSSHHNRVSRELVQKMVYKYLAAAGLEHKHCSVHKLRHTAATLMYRSGQVDIRVLKDILGHEQLSTTQIYTHVSDTEMERAMTQSPLSGLSASAIRKE